MERCNFEYSNFTWHKYSLGWSGKKSASRHTVSMQISLNLHNLCKNTKILLKNIILLKTNVLLHRNFPWKKPKKVKKELDT